MRAQIRDIEIHYELRGEGPRLLFLSGTGSDLRNPFTIYTTPLAKHFHILAFDQRGQGQTSQPEGPYDMGSYAEDARELLRHVGWASCLVMGASFGGMVAQELAIRYPDAVERLVLACTSAGGAGGSSFPLHTLIEMSQERRIEALVLQLDSRRDKQWADEHPSHFAAAMQMARFANFVGAGIPDWTGGMRRQLEARARHDTFERLGVLTMPVYICGGRYDAICPPENLARLQSQIPHAKLELFDGGHLFLGEDSRAANQIAAFLRG